MLYITSVAHTHSRPCHVCLDHVLSVSISINIVYTANTGDKDKISWVLSIIATISIQTICLGQWDPHC